MARAIDNTQLHALNELARTVSKGTSETMEAAIHLLNYIAAHNCPRRSPAAPAAVWFR